jgi:outer membrane protein OmpA-like peptidoglycan-associated protein
MSNNLNPSTMKKNVIILVTVLLLGMLSFSVATMGQPDPKSPRNDYKSFRIPAGHIRITRAVAYEDENSRIVVEFTPEDEFGNIYFGSLYPQNRVYWTEVSDSVNGIVTRLTRNDFHPGLRDYSGIEYVQEDLPNIIGIIYDVSNSMKNFDIDIILNALYDLIKYKKPDTMLDGGFFSRNLTRSVTSSSDPVGLTEQLESIIKPECSPGTNINTAGKREVEYESRVKVPGNKAVIIITEGKNNRFSTSRKELVRIANENHVRIFVISLGKHVRESYCEYVAMNTGGRYVNCYDPTNLMEAFDEILNHYMPVEKVVVRLTYDQPNNIPGQHFVNITICPPNGYCDRATIPVEERNTIREVLLNVRFGLNSAVVTPEYFNKLKSLKDPINNYLQNNPLDTLYIDSHTCDLGDAQYNYDLSVRRGDSVKQALYEVGVTDTSRIVVKGYGKTQPYTVTHEDHLEHYFLPEGQILDNNFIYNVLKDEAQREIARECNRRTHILIVVKLC